MTDKQVDGIILAGGRVHETAAIHEHLEQIRDISTRIPVVTVAGRMKGLDCRSVEADEHRAMELAVNYLVALRHARIGFLGGSRGIEPTDTRMSCFAALLRIHGLEELPEWCVEGGFDMQHGRATMEAFLQMRERPTAIVAFNDLNAIGAIHTALKNGLRVPEEVSVVGIDNIALTEYVMPTVTTVDLRPREQGRAAVDVMVDLLAGRTPKRHTVLEPRLVIRDSCTGAARARPR
jgi:DNA-binding LacI/PurR family transcriptional regulator